MKIKSFMSDPNMLQYERSNLLERKLLNMTNAVKEFFTNPSKDIRELSPFAKLLYQYSISTDRDDVLYFLNERKDAYYIKKIRNDAFIASNDFLDSFAARIVNTFSVVEAGCLDDDLNIEILKNLLYDGLDFIIIVYEPDKYILIDSLNINQSPAINSNKLDKASSAYAKSDKFSIFIPRTLIINGLYKKLEDICKIFNTSDFAIRNDNNLVTLISNKRDISEIRKDMDEQFIDIKKKTEAFLVKNDIRHTGAAFKRINFSKNFSRFNEKVYRKSGTVSTFDINVRICGFSNLLEHYCRIKF